MLVAEPHEEGIKRSNSQLPFCAWIVQITDPYRRIADDHGWLRTGPDHDHLTPGRVARSGQQLKSGQQLEVAVDWYVLKAGPVDPLRNRVVRLRERVIQLAPLYVDRPAREKVVTTTMIEVQMGVDDDVDAAKVKVPGTDRPKTRIHVGNGRVQLRHAGVDQDTRIGMIDDVHVDGHERALGQEVCDVNWRDRDGGISIHRFWVSRRRATDVVRSWLSAGMTIAAARRCAPTRTALVAT